MITIRTQYGSLVIDDIEAKDGCEAFDLACVAAMRDIENYAKVDEVYEYPE